MKRKSLLALLTASIGFAALGAFTACGDNDDGDGGEQVDGTQGLLYELLDDGQSYSVGLEDETDEKWNNANIVIPASYQGKPVTKIDDFGFSDSQIKSVTIPDSVTVIGNQAFDDCENLKTVTFGKSVTEIGDFAFESTSMESVNLPASVTKIGDQAFEENENLKTVTVNGNAVIGRMAFQDCTALTTAEFLGEESLTLGTSVFSDCTALKSVTINAADATLDDHAFMDCKPATYAATFETVYKTDFTSSIRSETPKELIFLRTETFSQETPVSDLWRVESVTLPASLTKCEQDAFKRYSMLKKVTFQGTIADWCKIEFENFDSNPVNDGAELIIGGNTVAGKLTVPAEATKIGDYAFCNYQLITEVELPAGFTEIGTYAFYNNQHLYNVNLPEGIAKIGQNAFRYCKLIQITLPQTLQSLGEYAFNNNTTLTRIINKSALTKAQIDTACAENTVSKHYQLITEPDASAVEKIGDFVFWKNENGLYYLMQYIGSEKQITLPAKANENAYAIHEYAFKDASLEKIAFEDPANWYRQSQYNQPQETDVTDSTANAENLQDNYYNYEWYQDLQ